MDVLIFYYIGCLPNFLQLICLLLMSVFDIDAQESEAEDDPHGGRHAEGRVHGRVHLTRNKYIKYFLPMYKIFSILSAPW